MNQAPGKEGQKASPVKASVKLMTDAMKLKMEKDKMPIGARKFNKKDNIPIGKAVIPINKNVFEDEGG